MVKKILVAVLLLCIGTGMAEAELRFGVKLGMNVNKLHLSDMQSSFTDADNRCGFTGGVMGEFTMPIVGIGVDASLMYTRMNSKIYNTLGEVTNKGRNFFEIPVNLKYKFNLPIVGNIVSPYLFTGPSFAFNLGGENDVFKTKTFQCAWNVGIGLELIKHLQIGASYGFGINNVAEKVLPGNMTTTSDFKVKNNYWTITAAYLF